MPMERAAIFGEKAANFEKINGIRAWFRMANLWMLSHSSVLIISKSFIQHLITEIVRETQSDFCMQISALKTLQLSAEIFLTTFFADIVTFYKCQSHLSTCWRTAISSTTSSEEERPRFFNTRTKWWPTALWDRCVGRPVARLTKTISRNLNSFKMGW